MTAGRKGGLELQRIVMSREVKVSVYEVQGTIAFPEDRSELTSILNMAEEKSEIDARDIVHKKTGLLPKRPRVMGQRLLITAETFGLLSQDQNRRGVFSLTEYGRRSLKQERIFVPEVSLWKIWTTDDPLLNNILHIERVTKESKEKVIEAPTLIKSTEGIVPLIRAHHTRSSEIEIKQIMPKARKLKRSENELYLELTAESGQRPILELSGSIGKGNDSKVERTVQISDEHTYDSILRYLVGRSKFNKRDWDEGRLSLACSFEDLTEGELRRHNKSVSISKPKPTGLGAFGNMEFQIPIHPRSAHEAKKWAEWKFWDGWDEVPWPDKVKKRWEKILKGRDWGELAESDQPLLDSRINSIRLELKNIEYPNLKARKAEDIFALSNDQKRLFLRLRTLLMKCQAVQDIGGE